MTTRDYQKLYEEKRCSMDEILASIKSGDVMIRIAHPEDRDRLTEEAKELGYLRV